MCMIILFAMLNNHYRELFGKLPIFGMIHLAGDTPVRRALQELSLFEEEGIDGAIVENYHGSIQNVIETLQEVQRSHHTIHIGVNILPNEFSRSLSLAQVYGAEFVQLDHVAGTYTAGTLDFSAYAIAKKKHADIIVLGGVWPKYYLPMQGSTLEEDVKTGMQRAEAIVVTGAGTGKETPFEKIRKFRELLGEHPLVIGAGLTPDNAYTQLCIADGAIVGSSLKEGNNTNNPVDRQRVKAFMSVVKEARNLNYG
jgi:uncharacterized protein